MKYIRTYGDYNSWKLDYSDHSRGFRLKPTLYKYSDTNVESKILLENDDPRKYRDEGSTYMEITLDSDTEFSFYIGNAPGNTETTMDCRVNWGDSTVDENLSIIADGKGFKLSHSYKAGSYSIELHKVARDYSIIGDGANTKSLISHPSSVKRVILGDGVVDIGDRAFDYCSSLTSISISKGVASIGDCTFYFCTSLKSIYIPESVTRIKGRAFYGCKSLTSIYIPESVTSIGDWVFSECRDITSVHIPEGITTIECGMFADCTSLTSVYIPEGVTSIGESVFEQCFSLTSVYIPEGVTSIGRYAFTYCTSLTSVNIPEGVTSIGEAMFMKCSSLTSISSLNTTAPTLDINVFASLPTNGTLYIKPGATGYDAWLNALPSGWRIVESL